MPELKDGEVLLESLYVSVDPGMRGFMNREKMMLSVFFENCDKPKCRKMDFAK